MRIHGIGLPMLFFPVKQHGHTPETHGKSHVSTTGNQWKHHRFPTVGVTEAYIAISQNSMENLLYSHGLSMVLTMGFPWDTGSWIFHGKSRERFSWECLQITV